MNANLVEVAAVVVVSWCVVAMVAEKIGYPEDAATVVLGEYILNNSLVVAKTHAARGDLSPK